MPNWGAQPLAETLALDPIDECRFRARLPGFGGVTLGCAARAAAATCEDKSLHSLHTYFFRAVIPDGWCELVVERIRDGRRFSHRRIQVRSEAGLHCELIASFAAAGTGVEYQEIVPASVPQPEELPTEEEIARAEGWREGEPGPLHGDLTWRWIGGTPWTTAVRNGPSPYTAWVRPSFPLPADRALNVAAIAFLSDYHSHLSVARKLGGFFDPRVGYTSLDQVLWVHRDVFWDDWWLIRTQSEVASSGRSLSQRRVYTRDGRLIVSMAQEALIPNLGGDQA